VDDQINDQQFEAYLRNFHPLSAAPLPKRGRNWGLIALGAAAAGMIVMLWLHLHIRRMPPLSQPSLITIRSANQLLAGASSWKSVIDDAGFAFSSSSTNVVPRHKSALEFLGQEDLSIK